ncbi:MAG: response regulator, partial [Clostridia bacterium]|nr:response regulator [Clostridia bacterium]
MYTVFLVDDEIVIREGIRNSFPWERTQYTLAGEAQDGEIALSILKDIKPDILITDIRMPFMDGLALSRIVSRTMPWVHIVILSGYDDFAYAQEAISVGVCEYLLKPVSAEDLNTALDRISDRIHRERAEQEDRAVLRGKFETQARSMREHFLFDIMTGVIAAEQALSRARELSLQLISHRYAAMAFAYAGTPTPDRLTLMAHLRRLSDGSEEQVHVCASGPLILSLVLGDSDTDIEERAYAFAQAAKHEIERGMGCTLSVAIGETVGRIAHIASSLGSAQRALSHLGALHAGKIFSERDLVQEKGSLLMDLTVTPLPEQLKFATPDDIPRIVSHYASMLGDTAVRSTLIAHYVFVEVLFAASRIVKEHGGNPEEVLPDAARQEMLIGVASSPNDILTMCEDMLRRAIAFRAQKTDTRYGPVILKARAYIETNYSNPDITLHSVAREVALSSSHFCTIFSQEMGLTFIEYLTNLRVENAKRLLRTTSMMSSEIAYDVGYNDPHYFS